MRRPLLGLAAFACAFLPACTTARDVQRLDEMTPAEAERFEVRVRSQVRLATTAALEAGDISPDAATLVAQALSGLADGTSAGAVGALELEGYGALALSLAVVEIDAALDQSGAYSEDGLLSERGRAILRSVAESIDYAVELYVGPMWTGRVDG